MSKWCVSIPVTGYVNVTVEAEDDDAAIKLAFSAADFCVKCKGDTEAGEFEVHHVVCAGNCSHATLNKPCAVEVE